MKLLALFLLALAWISIHPKFPPLAVDSIYYLTGSMPADTWAIGTEWPPLYPVILSVFPYPYVLNALCYAGCVVLVYAHLHRYRLALTAALFTPAFTINFLHVWSEPLFIALTAAFFMVLLRARCHLLALTLLAALALMQRYSGVVLVVVGAVFILYRWGWKPSLTFVLLPTTCLLAWITRNVVYGLPPMGYRPPPAHTWLENTEAALATVLTWLILVGACVCVSWCISRLTRFLSSRAAAHP